MPRKYLKTTTETQTQPKQDVKNDVQHATQEEQAQPPVLSQPDNAATTPDATIDQAAAESKADKFRRLATARMTKALKAVSQLENLANKSQYEFTPEQVEKMLTSLTNAVGEVKRKFAGTKRDSGGFIF